MVLGRSRNVSRLFEADVPLEVQRILVRDSLPTQAAAKQASKLYSNQTPNEKDG